MAMSTASLPTSTGIVPIIPLKKKWTIDEFLALPDDGIERCLINGELREGSNVTRRSRFHSFLMADITMILQAWVHSQPVPRGRIVCGDAGFRLSTDPTFLVGTDVAYISAMMATATPDHTTLFDGAPILAVEILSPSDTMEQIDEKLEGYLKYGTQLVWIVSNTQKTITAHAPYRRPRLFTLDDDLTAEGILPGFCVAVREILGEAR
ncbi:MAG: Uma2 family endonuclease [Gemmataceae bacterium]